MLPRLARFTHLFSLKGMQDILHNHSLTYTTTPFKHEPNNGDHQQRVGTASTAATSPQSIFSSPQRRTSFGFLKSSPTVNVHTTCGRHTDQLLFGGPSLSGLARAFLGKKKQRRVSSN